jgi:hypothetical protein
MPTVDPTCPPYICSAKPIYRKNVRATDGLDGGSDDEEELGGDNADNNNDKEKNAMKEGEGGRGDEDYDNGNDSG